MGERLARRRGVEAGEHQPRQTVAADPGQSIVGGDQPFLGQLGRDGERGLGGALAHPGLQHPQDPALDGELDVAQVPVVALQGLGVIAQSPVRARVQPFQIGQRHGVAYPRHDVLALRMGQVVAVQAGTPGRRVAGEGDTAAGVRAEVAEHHALHGDRGPQIVRDVLAPPVQDGAVGVPGPEHGEDRLLQLLGGGLWEVAAGLVPDQPLVRLHQPCQVARVEMEVVGGLAGLLQQGHGLVEQRRIDSHHRAPVHLDEPAVGVPGEPLVAGHLGQAEHGVVVQTDVEDRLHHARHGETRPGADGHQQRVVRLPQQPPGGGLQRRQVP